MPVKLADLQNKTGRVTLSWEDESVTVIYRKALVTPRFLRELDAAEKAVADQMDESSAAIQNGLNQLQQLVSGWDIVDDNGEPLPVTQETLERLPVRFCIELLRRIQEDMLPNSPRPEENFGSLS